MRAGRNLRDDAAVQLVLIELRTDDVRKDGTAAVGTTRNDGRRGFIAAGFNAQDDYVNGVGTAHDNL